MEVLKPIVFRVGNGYYGIDIKSVYAIEKEQTIVGVPNSSSNILGIINLRGEVDPVYSLRNKFKLPKSPVPGSMLICKLDKMKLAIMVDEVEEISDVSEENINDLPSIAINPETRFFKKVINIDNKLILIIDVNELLTNEEEKNAEQLMEEK